MTWIYLGTTPIKGIYVWTTPVKEVYLGITKVRSAETVQTFDFQNWDLWRTATSFGYWTPSRTPWWWTIYRSNDDADGYIVPPASVYNWGTLQKVKIWMYKWARTTWTSSRAYWVSAGWIGSTTWVRWSEAWANINYDRIYNNGSPIQTADITGEVIWELNLESATPTLTLNWNVYTLTWLTSAWFQTDWTNQNSKLDICNWRCGSWTVYIRKVEITTV